VTREDSKSVFTGHSRSMSRSVVKCSIIDSSEIRVIHVHVGLVLGVTILFPNTTSVGCCPLVDPCSGVIKQQLLALSIRCFDTIRRHVSFMRLPHTSLIAAFFAFQQSAHITGGVA